MRVFPPDGGSGINNPVGCVANGADVVCTGDGDFIEVQGTAEGDPLRRAQLDELLGLAVAGCASLTKLQREALASPVPCAGARAVATKKLSS